MRLNTHRWSASASESLVCIHGATQHGGVFEPLAHRFTAAGYSVVSLDLRGHGGSGREPPWNTEAHVCDVLETLDGLGIERCTWIGHSFGALVAATVAARAPQCVGRLVLLDPGFPLPPALALTRAETQRLDWSFESVDGAVNALLSDELVVSAPRAAMYAYAQDDLRPGPDGRLRFSYCPSAAVVMWSEMTLSPPPIARLPTLVVRAEQSSSAGRAQDERYRGALDGLLTLTRVPNGHNVLWESLPDTGSAIEAFLAQHSSGAFSEQSRTAPLA